MVERAFWIRRHRHGPESSTPVVVLEQRKRHICVLTFVREDLWPTHGVTARVLVNPDALRDRQDPDEIDRYARLG